PNDDVFAGMSIHALAKALFPILGDQTGLVKLLDQVVEVVAGFQDDAAPAAAVAPARTALGHKILAMKRDCAFASVPRPGVNFYLVDEHLCLKLISPASSAK